MSGVGETASELAQIPRGTSFLAAAISAGCATQVLAVPAGHRPAPTTNVQNKNVNKINDKSGLNEPSTCSIILLDPFTPSSFIYLSISYYKISVKVLVGILISKEFIEFQRIYYNNLKKISKYCVQTRNTFFDMYHSYKISDASEEKTDSNITSHITSPATLLAFYRVRTGLLTIADYISIAHRATITPYAPNTKTIIVSSVCGRAY